MKSFRSLSMGVWSALAVVVLIAIGLTLLSAFDWNRARPWINTRVTAAIGRPFAIHGDLALDWGKAPVTAPGWRSWIPWPRLLARDITIGNPAWTRTAPNMAEFPQAAFSVNPLLLLDKKIVIPNLQLEALQLTLERVDDGRNNWTFKPQSPSDWQLELQQLVLNKGSVRIVDAIRHIDVSAAVNTLAGGQLDGYGIGWKLAGTAGGEPISGTGRAGAVLSLLTHTARYPIEAALQAGQTAISISGSLTRPRDPAAVDLRLRLSGISLAKLFPLTGIVLPETPPFSADGRLIGAPNQQGGNWVYEKFSGKVGSSDVAGTLEYQSRQPRALVKGTVVSNVLQFRDLAPLIGADSNASKIRRGATPVQPPNRVLPAEQFKTERWTSIDAEVKFTGRRIIRDKELPIDNLAASLRLQDGVLTLAPLNFGIAGGTFRSNIKLDGRDKTIKAEVKMTARHLKLKQLFPTFQPMQASLGEINGDASLSATGNSIAAMLGSSNGEIKALINQGTISKLLLEQIGLNLGNVILTEIFGDKQVKLNCMASDFAVANGLMQARTFIIDTDAALLHVSGQINLTQERLALTIHPRSKGLRIISLRSPLYVRGSFAHPQVDVDKGVLAFKAGSAVALALLAPLATALIPLANMGQGTDSECAKLLSQARIKPLAPPPGKSARGPAGK